MCLLFNQANLNRKRTKIKARKRLNQPYNTWIWMFLHFQLCKNDDMLTNIRCCNKRQFKFIKQNMCFFTLEQCFYKSEPYSILFCFVLFFLERNPSFAFYMNRRSFIIVISIETCRRLVGFSETVVMRRKLLMFWLRKGNTLTHIHDTDQRNFNFN